MIWVAKAERPVVDAMPTGAGAQEWQALHRAADDAAPALAQTLQQALSSIGSHMDREAILRALETGDMASIVDQLTAGWEGIRPDLHAALQEGLEAVTLAGASASLPGVEALIGTVGEGQLAVVFGQVNEAALRYIVEATGSLVTSVGEETVRAIRTLVERAFQEGRAPYEVMRDVFDLVGLTDGQTLAVERYRQQLIHGGFSRGRVTELVGKKIEQLRQWRAENIVRTETINAASAGQQRTWEILEEHGLFPPGMRRFWLVSSDQRLCRVCAPIPGLNPQGVGLREPFQSPQGPVMRPTAHPS